MPRPDEPAEDFRRVLREKALSHSLFYLKLGGAGGGAGRGAGAGGGERRRRAAVSAAARAPPTARVRPPQPRVSELLRRFEPAPMQYLRPPRPLTPPDDITSSDEDDRAAVRRRSRDLSDDSAVELEPRRRHSHPRDATPPPPDAARRDRTLVEAHVVELGRRSSEGGGRARCVRTPSVVVSDYSDGPAAGATREEAAWLRARSLSADSACSSCSTLSSRDEEEFESPALVKKLHSRVAVAWVRLVSDKSVVLPQAESDVNAPADLSETSRTHATATHGKRGLKVDSRATGAPGCAAP